MTNKSISGSNIIFNSVELDGFRIDSVVGTDVLHRFPLHIHDSLCVGVITEGRRKMVISGKDFTFEQNEIFIINPNESHAIEGFEPHSYIAITVSGCSIEKAFNNKIKSDACVEILYLLSDAIMNGNTASICRYSDELQSHLRRNEVRSVVPPFPEKILKAQKFVRAGLQNNISVNDMAAHVCMSRFHFCRLFKKHTGISPHAYLMQLRLKTSYLQLKSNKTVFDAAIDAGFYDSSHFIRTFFSYMGVSPKNYQDSIFQQ